MLPKPFKALARSDVIVVKITLLNCCMAFAINLPKFWAMASFPKVLTHAKNTDNHCWSAVMQYFECMVPKTFYSCFLCLRNEKVINFQFFPTLVQEKSWPQQLLWYLAKNVVAIWCRTVWSIFVHNLVTIEQKIKKWWRECLMPPAAYLNSKKLNPCRVKDLIHFFCEIVADDFELAVTGIVLQRRVRKRRLKRKPRKQWLKRGRRKGAYYKLINEMRLNDWEVYFK